MIERLESFGAHDPRIDWFFIRRIKSWQISKFLWARKRFAVEYTLFAIAMLWFLGVDFHIELEWWVIPVSYILGVIFLVRFLMFVHKCDEDTERMF